MSQHAIENAQSWFENIREMVEAYQAFSGKYGNPDWKASEVVEQAILESPLSVQVRSGWYSLGDRQRDDAKPTEYEILLSTGGPALRIIGELSEHGQPEDARLQWQDWGTPWTDVHMSALCGRETGRGGGASRDIQPSEVDEILLAYASVFYLGE